MKKFRTILSLCLPICLLFVPQLAFGASLKKVYSDLEMFLFVGGILVLIISIIALIICISKYRSTCKGGFIVGIVCACVLIFIAAGICFFSMIGCVSTDLAQYFGRVASETTDIASSVSDAALG